MSSKLEKIEGGKAKEVTAYIAEKLREEFLIALRTTGHVHPEFNADCSNTSAYLQIKKEKIPNITYALGTLNIEELEFTGRTLYTDFIKSLNNEKISFRQELTIDTIMHQGFPTKYMIYFRAAKVTPEQLKKYYTAPKLKKNI
jgi:hypothetical protein